MRGRKCTMPSVEEGQTAILATDFGDLQTFLDELKRSELIVQHVRNGTYTDILDIWKGKGGALAFEMKVPRFLVDATRNLTLTLPDVGKSDEGRYLFRLPGAEEIRYACNFTLATPPPPVIACTTPTTPSSSSTWLPPCSCDDGAWKNASIALALPLLLLLLLILLLGIGAMVWRCRRRKQAGGMV